MRCTKSGRPIVYSLCQYGMRTSGSGGRRSAAICGARPATFAITGHSMTQIGFDKQAGLEKYSRRRDIGTIRTCWRSAMAA